MDKTAEMLRRHLHWWDDGECTIECQPWHPVSDRGYPEWLATVEVIDGEGDSHAVTIRFDCEDGSVQIDLVRGSAGARLNWSSLEEAHRVLDALVAADGMGLADEYDLALCLIESTRCPVVGIL